MKLTKSFILIIPQFVFVPTTDVADTALGGRGGGGIFQCRDPVWISSDLKTYGRIRSWSWKKNGWDPQCSQEAYILLE